MSKCLRCGAGPEWLQGKIPNEQVNPSCDNPTTGKWTAEKLETELRYIADSPAQEHGGFHPRVVETAKQALAALAAERLRIWREAPNQLDVQEAVIKKLNLVAAEQLAAERERCIAVVKREIDNCNHPGCVADRKTKGYSSCAGGHIARRVVAKIGGKQ